MVHRSKPLEVLYKRYNPLVRSVSSIGLQIQRKNVYKIPTCNRFRSRKPLKNPRDLTSFEPKFKKVSPQSYYNLDCRKLKNQQEIPKKTTVFPIFVTKSQFALQRRGSGKSLAVNPSKVKIHRQIIRRKVKRKGGPKYKMITGNKRLPKNKMSKSSTDQLKSIARREDCKCDDGYRGQKDLDENEWEACRNNESKNSNTQKKNRDIYGNILGPTPDEAILAGLQTVIEMCSMVDRKPVKKNSIQEVNKQKIMDWVKSEYLLLSEEIRTSTSDLSIENLTERKETLQEIEVLVRKKYELEHKGSELKTVRNVVDVENENPTKSNSRQLSVYYATQPSTISDLDLESLENSNETLNDIRASHSIRKNNLEVSKSSKNLENNSKPILKKNQHFQTICVCDKTTQVMEGPSLSESIESSRTSEHSIKTSEASSISLVEIKSSVENMPTCSCGIPPRCCHVAKSTQFTPDPPSACTKSTQFSNTICKCQSCESSSESSSSSEHSSDPIPNMRSQIVNFFNVYTDREALTTTSSTTSVKSSSHPSLKVNSTSNLTIASIDQPKKLSQSTKVKGPIELDTPTSKPRAPLKSASTSTTELKSSPIEQPKKLIGELSKSVVDKYTPIKLDITSSTPHVPLKFASTSTTELKPNMMSKNVSFVPEQSTKCGQTVEHKPCLHVEHFTPTTIKPIMPEFDSTHKSMQTSTYDETSAKSSQTISPSTVCTQSIQIPSKTQSTIDLMSKHAQTPLLGHPCTQSTQTFGESVNTSLEAHSSTLMVQKAVQTKVTFDQPYKSSSDTTTTCVSTTEKTTSGTSLEEESSSCDVSSKPTVDTCTFSCGKILTNVTTQCDSISQSNAATDPWSVQIASCQTSLSHCKCIINDYTSIATPKFPAYQRRVFQMCNANTCPMLQEAMVNISGEQSNKKNLVRADKRSYSFSRIQVCNPSTCPMLKSASVNICADLDYPQYKFKEKTKRKIQMCSSRNCRMLKEAIINITNFDVKPQEGDSCDCKIAKLKSMKRKQDNVQRCSAKTHPVLQQSVVNICSIENNTDSFKPLASKCSCYRENLDGAYITCKEVPMKACAARDDCFCNSIKEEEQEVKRRREIESEQYDDDTEHEEVLEEEILVEEEKVAATKKETIINIEEFETPKVKIREINEPERVELRQKERVSQESCSSKAVAVNKDKGNSKSSTQRIRQAGVTLKLAIRLPSPVHNLPCGAAWIRKK